MAKIIAFANQKGGVGKTTSTVNIAASLCVMGYRVLLIDMDPQGNATTGLGIMKRTLTKTIYDMLAGDASAKDVIVRTKYNNLSMIPAHTTLARAESVLDEAENGMFIMREKLKEVDGDFDYIVIDCPPSLGMLSVNALSAANGVVIPMQCEFFALEGLSQLVQTINAVKKGYNENLNITGILITMYSSRYKSAAYVIEELRKHYDSLIFETPISRNIKVAEAPSFGSPAYFYDKSCKGAKEYLNVAKELAERI